MDEGLFNGGPPTRLYAWLRLRKSAQSRALSLRHRRGPFGLAAAGPAGGDPGRLIALPFNVVLKDLAKFLI